jgi:hypothetical protein
MEKKKSEGVSSLAIIVCFGAIILLLITINIDNWTHWGLNWKIARNVGVILSIIGFIISIGLFRLKLWALQMYIVMAILNLIWILLERVFYFNGYVVALVITIADFLRACGRLECTQVESPVFINTITGSSLRDINALFWYTTLQYQLLVALFYIATIAYLTRPKVKEQFKKEQ